MEKKFLSGLSLFDFLAMVIPGGLIIAIVGKWLGYKPFVIETEDTKGFFAYLIVLVASYLVGLVWNAFMEFCCFKLRNNPKCTTIVLRKVRKKTRRRYWYVLDEIIDNDYHLLQKVGSCLCKEKISKDERLGLRCMYYEAYYYVATHSINSSIAIMESQVAFMRNMVVPLVIVTACVESFFRLSENVCCVQVWMSIVIVLMIVVMFLRQYKIYWRVWEDCIFLNYLESKQLEKNRNKR